jgi:hypothetical protein
MAFSRMTVASSGGGQRVYSMAVRGLLNQCSIKVDSCTISLVIRIGFFLVVSICAGVTYTCTLSRFVP